MLRRYLHARRRQAQHADSVNYREFGDGSVKLVLPSEKNPLSNLYREKLLPRGDEAPEVPSRTDERMEGTDVTEAEEEVVWGSHLPRYESKKVVNGENGVHRPEKTLEFSVGALQRFTGSGCAAIGTTKAFAFVFGPCPLSRRTQYSDEAYLRVKVRIAVNSREGRVEDRLKTKSATKEEKELARMVKTAVKPAVILDGFPKSQVYIKVVITEDDGCALSAAVLASCLALAGSGFPCSDVVSCGKIVMQGKNSVVPDPFKHEEYNIEKALTRYAKDDKNVGEVTMTVLPRANQISMFSLRGKIDRKWLPKLCDEARRESTTFLEGLEDSMVRFALWQEESDLRMQQQGAVRMLKRGLENGDIKVLAVSKKATRPSVNDSLTDAEPANNVDEDMDG